MRRLAIMVAVFLVGCGGSSQKRCYPVQGQLFVNTKPAEKALIVLTPLPKADASQWPAGYPRGTVRQDGSFDITTYAPDDGAPAGDYVVTVLWLRSVNKDRTEGGAEYDELQGRYADPTTSKLRISVTADKAGNRLEPFHLD